MKIAVVTFAVGADYKRAMAPGLESKQAWCTRHGYDFHCGGDSVWDRSRPISWSKVLYFRQFLDSGYDYLFVSDADVLITNPAVRIEDVILPELENKDLLWTKDECGNLNAGHLFLRCSARAWIHSFFDLVWKQEDLIHHIWWENAGMIQVLQTVPDHAAHVATCIKSWLFNAYLFGPSGKAVDPSRRLWQEEDLLIHFAGVYRGSKINAMMKYVQSCLTGSQKVDRGHLENLLKE
jgi:hypothetical protein